MRFGGGVTPPYRFVWRGRNTVLPFLLLKHPHAAPRRTDRSVIHLGRRVSRAGLSPTPQNLQRMRERIGERLRTGDDRGIRQSIASYGGLFR